MAKRGGLGTNLDALIPLTVDNVEDRKSTRLNPVTATSRMPSSA